MDEAEVEEAAAKEAAEYDAWFRRQVQIGLDEANAGDVVTHEEMVAEIATWRAEARRKMAEEAAAKEAAEYDAWFRRKVQEALDDESECLTDEEMEAEAETWYAETRRQMAAEARRVANEVGLEALGEG